MPCGGGEPSRSRTSRGEKAVGGEEPAESPGVPAVLTPAPRRMSTAPATWVAHDAAPSCWPEPPQAIHRLYGRHDGLG